MDFEKFANAHPIGYVHIAYAVVILLHFGYLLWMLWEWHRLRNAESRLATLER